MDRRSQHESGGAKSAAAVACTRAGVVYNVGLDVRGCPTCRLTTGRAGAGERTRRDCGGAAGSSAPALGEASGPERAPVELAGAAGALAAAVAARLWQRAAARAGGLSGRRRGRGRGARWRPGLFPAERAGDRRSRWPRHRPCWSCPRPRTLALRRDAARSPHADARGWRCCSGSRAGSRRAVLVASAAALFRRVMPRAAVRALVLRVDSGRGDRSRRAGRRRWCGPGSARAPVVEDAGTFAVRGRGHRPVSAGLSASRAHRAVRRRGRVDPALRRGHPAHAAHAGRACTCTRCARPSRRRAPTRAAKILAAADAAAYPSSKTRQLLEQIEAGEDVLRHRGAGAGVPRRMAPLFDYLPPGALVVVEDPEAVCEEARARARSCARAPSHRRAEHRLALPTRTEFVLDEDEARAALAARARVELRAVEVASSRARAAAPTCAPRVHMESEPHTTLRAELPSGRRARRRREAATPTAASTGRALRERMRRVAGRRAARARRGAQPHPRRSPGWRCSRPRAWRRRSCRQQARADGLERAARRRAPRRPLAILAGPLARGFRAARRPAGAGRGGGDLRPARARARRAPAQARRRARRSGRDRRGRSGRARRARRRALPRAQEAGACAACRRTSCTSSTTAAALPAGLPARRGATLRRRRRRDASGSTSWAADLGGEAPARLGRGAQDRRGAAAALRAARRAARATPSPRPTRSFREFEATFPFDETPDQAQGDRRRCSATCRRPRPMDRLVCGDVGYGKTEVALRAALLAVLGGKQVAVLAPTTVLVEQHFLTFSERLRRLPGARRDAVALPQQGRADETVATLADGQARRRRRHAPAAVARRALQGPGPAGHRRGAALRRGAQGAAQGAAHAGRRADADRDADPAHAAHGDGGLREISIIATPPADRLAIRTFVCRWDTRPAARGDRARAGARRPGVLRAQPRRGPRRSGARSCATLVPAGRASRSAHGQMAEGELEKVMVDFVDGRFDMLVLHDDHRVGPRHPARQHDDRQPRRPLRPGAALPAARAHRPLARARVLLPGRPRARRA